MQPIGRCWRLGDHLQGDDAGDLPRWLDKQNDLLVNLLHKMSRALRYDFSEITLKKNIYSPIAHGDLEKDQYLLRKYVVELPDGKRPIWVVSKQPTSPEEPGLSDQPSV